MFKGSFEIMGGSPSWRVITVPCLVAIGLVQVDIESIKYVTSCDFTKARD